MTIGDFKQSFIGSFTNYDVSERVSILQIILEETLGMNHVASVIHHDDEISQEKLLELKAITQQLARNVPIHYIYQKAHFFGLDLYVDQRVLIPRQETEELVDWIISTHWGKENLHILDIGTGSGAIAIALKKHLPKAKVVAMDISEGALEVARTNAKRNRAVIEFVQQDILQVEDLGVCFDLIVSNPPYVREQEKREMHPNVLAHEPSLALFVPDDNPLLFYEKIADIATRNLTSGGKLFFEINQYLGREMLQMLKGKGFQYLLKKDLNENDRMIMSQLAN
jgi:protein-(glutamine-N5) methyltransferase, release factor-specific